MSVNYCQLETRSTWLSTDFGKELAMRWLEKTEEELEEIVGRYSRGKRKGLLKGQLVWLKAVKGGWFKTDSYDHERGVGCGYVVKRNACLQRKITDYNGEVLYKLEEPWMKESRERAQKFHEEYMKKETELTIKEIARLKNTISGCKDFLDSESEEVRKNCEMVIRHATSDLVKAEERLTKLENDDQFIDFSFDKFD